MQAILADGCPFVPLKEARRFGEVRGNWGDVLQAAQLSNFQKGTAIMTCMRFLGLCLVGLGSMPLAFGQLSITSVATEFGQDFNALSSTAPTGLDLTNLNGANGWRVGFGSTPTFSGGTNLLTQIQSATLTSTSSGGSYNFRDGAATTDRAVGFLTSNTFASPRSLMGQLTNNTGATITSLDINWIIEKYRSGTREFTSNFYTSLDGTTWTIHSAASTTFAADANNNGISTPLQTPKSLSLIGLSIADSASFFIRFDVVGTGGSSNGQALGFDDFRIVANPVPEPASLIAMAAAGLGVVTWRRRRKA